MSILVGCQKWNWWVEGYVHFDRGYENACIRGCLFYNNDYNTRECQFHLPNPNSLFIINLCDLYQDDMYKIV